MSLEEKVRERLISSKMINDCKFSSSAVTLIDFKDEPFSSISGRLQVCYYPASKPLKTGSVVNLGCPSTTVISIWSVFSVDCAILFVSNDSKLRE